MCLPMDGKFRPQKGRDQGPVMPFVCAFEYVCMCVHMHAGLSDCAVVSWHSGYQETDRGLTECYRRCKLSH